MQKCARRLSFCIGLWQMSLCLCPLIFNSDAGHKSRSVGLKDHFTRGSRAIKCTHNVKIFCTLKTCSGNEIKPTANEGVGRISINCALTMSSTPSYLKPGSLAFLRSYHHLGNSSAPPTQGSQSFKNWHMSSFQNSNTCYWMNDQRKDRRDEKTRKKLSVATGWP